jgi:hypothetical protein
MSLSHEKELEKAWLARPKTEKRVNIRMVATIGEVDAVNLPLYFMTLAYCNTGGKCNVFCPIGNQTQSKKITSRVLGEYIHVQGSTLSGWLRLPRYNTAAQCAS